jgi:hypothetical protein
MLLMIFVKQWGKVKNWGLFEANVTIISNSLLLLTLDFITDWYFMPALHNSVTSLYSIMKFPDECRDNMTRLHTEVIMWSKHIARNNRRKQTAMLLIVSSIWDINQSFGITVSKVGWMWWSHVNLQKTQNNAYCSGGSWWWCIILRIADGPERIHAPTLSPRDDVLPSEQRMTKPKILGNVNVPEAISPLDGSGMAPWHMKLSLLWVSASCCTCNNE